MCSDGDRDTQSVNAKVETLSREKEKQKNDSLHDNERSHSERHIIVCLLGLKKMTGMKDREELDGIKFKIPPFLRECKPNNYLMLSDIRRMMRPPYETWAELKRIDLCLPIILETFTTSFKGYTMGPKV
ncbi:hypothetical protein CR513_13769, partial [Mucuna pruriens]